MFAVTGITGQVGSAVAENLLRQGHKVRALVRDPDKGRRWKEKGCELAIGDFNDPAALARASLKSRGRNAIRPTIWRLPLPSRWAVRFPPPPSRERSGRRASAAREHRILVRASRCWMVSIPIGSSLKAIRRNTAPAQPACRPSFKR